MGLTDRDYQRNAAPGGGGFMPRLTPVVKWLLIANIGIYLLDLFLAEKYGRVFDLAPIQNWGAFNSFSTIREYRLWEVITFQFIHANLQHLILNCIGLWIFGPWMERWWGSARFTAFYLLCGVAGAMFCLLLTSLHLLPEIRIPAEIARNMGLGGSITADGMIIFSPPLVGASAGIYGILIGVAMIAPNLRVLLMFVIELSMRQLAIVLMVISTGTILFSIGSNEGGEAGHLGGAILGFILMRFPWLLGGDPDVETIRPRAFTNRSDAKLRPRTSVELERDTAVDIILDKISRDGFQSLNQEEKDILLKASERKNSDS